MVSSAAASGLPSPLRVLMVEDNPGDARLVTEQLIESGLTIQWIRVDNEADFRRGLADGPHVVLCDYGVPGFEAPHALRVLKELGLAGEVPVLIVSGTIGEESAVRLMREGAADYLLKDRIARLGEAVRSAIERTLEQKALVDSERSYRDLFEKVPVALIRVTPDGHILDANPMMLELLGYPSLEELATRRAHDLYGEPEERDRFAALLVRQGSVRDYAAAMRHRDGSLRSVSMNASVSRGPTGEPIAFEAVIVDQTPRHQMEKELRLAFEKASESDRLKSAFLANISHEVRTPINVILGYNSLIADEIRDRVAPDVCELLDRVERAGHRLVNTIQSLLEFSKIEVGTFDLYPKEIEPQALLSSLVDRYRLPAQEKGLVLLCELEAEGTRVVFDEYSLQRALDCVLDNAVKFTSRGEIRARLAHQAGGSVLFEIRDTGIGIDSRYLGSLFRPFSQEDAGATRSFEGTGLGLALARRLLERNGATIRVESAKGKGTVVGIEIPPALVRSPAILTPGASSTSPGEDTAGGGPIVLVVEDDVATRLFMRKTLSRQTRVEVAEDAEAARRILERCGAEIGLVLMDLSLGGGEDGISFTRWLRADSRWRGLRVIATTAHALPADRQSALDAGCDDFLTKPIDRAVLSKLVSETSRSGRGEGS